LIIKRGARVTLFIQYTHRISIHRDCFLIGVPENNNGIQVDAVVVSINSA